MLRAAWPEPGAHGQSRWTEFIVARYSREIVVPTSLDTTFAYLSKFSSAQEWDPGVIAAEMVTPEPVGLGSRFRLTAVFLGARVPLEYEIIEYDPPRRVVLTAENRSVLRAESS